MTNTGTKIGKEVVQLYLGDPVCSVVRPLKELKHFTKVEVEPDETVQVEFVITPDDLKFFDEASHRWIAEPGVFNVYVGTSSADIRCMHSLNIYVIDVIIQRQLNIYVKKTYCLLGSTLHNESFF